MQEHDTSNEKPQVTHFSEFKLSFIQVPKGKPIVYLDVDSTLLGDEYEINPSSDLAKNLPTPNTIEFYIQFNLSLLKFLLEEGLNDIYLFTNMMPVEVMHAATNKFYIHRYLLTERLRLMGFNVLGVITPPDALINKNYTDPNKFVFAYALYIELHLKTIPEDCSKNFKFLSDSILFEIYNLYYNMVHLIMSGNFNNIKQDVTVQKNMLEDKIKTLKKLNENLLPSILEAPNSANLPPVTKELPKGLVKGLQRRSHFSNKKEQLTTNEVEEKFAELSKIIASLETINVTFDDLKKWLLQQEPFKHLDWLHTVTEPFPQWKKGEITICARRLFPENPIIIFDDLKSVIKTVNASNTFFKNYPPHLGIHIPFKTISFAHSNYYGLKILPLTSKPRFSQIWEIIKKYQLIKRTKSAPAIPSPEMTKRDMRTPPMLTNSKSAILKPGISKTDSSKSVFKRVISKLDISENPVVSFAKFPSAFFSPDLISKKIAASDTFVTFSNTLRRLANKNQVTIIEIINSLSELNSVIDSLEEVHKYPLLSQDLQALKKILEDSAVEILMYIETLHPQLNNSKKTTNRLLNTIKTTFREFLNANNKFENALHFVNFISDLSPESFKSIREVSIYRLYGQTKSTGQAMLPEKVSVEFLQDLKSTFEKYIGKDPLNCEQNPHMTTEKFIY